MNDPLGIRALSSGTLASLMRQSCRFLLYQCADSWWIDKLQLHFWWFSRTGHWKRWQDCWQDYLRLLDRWSGSRYCSYMGETDMYWQGKQYVLGHCFDPTYPHWNGQKVIDNRLATLGAVYAKHAQADPRLGLCANSPFTRKVNSRESVFSRPLLSCSVLVLPGHQSFTDTASGFPHQPLRRQYLGLPMRRRWLRHPTPSPC
jgi:hypothetical protein